MIIFLKEARKHHLFLTYSLTILYSLKKCQSGEMVDTADSKSAACKGIPVRVRRLVPYKKQGFTGFTVKPFLLFTIT